MDNPWVMFGLFPMAAYVIGSTPWGVMLARARGVDLRATGSGNVGATNVGRVLGRRWGYLCFALDVLKGLLPVLGAGWLLGATRGTAPTWDVQVAWLLVGCGAIGGHVLSFWLRFRGGKGVATGLGVVLGLWPFFTLAGLAALALWVAITLISRYVSLGSIVAALSFVPFAILFHWRDWTDLWVMNIFGMAMCGLIVLRHRANIVRLIKGQENKIGKKKEAVGRGL